LFEVQQQKGGSDLEMKYRGSSIVDWIVTSLGKVFASDSEDRAGVGPFSLPPGHPFHRAAAPHDFYYVEARKFEAEGRTLDMVTLQEADERLARAMIAIALNAPTQAERLELLIDFTAYWPWALKVGMFIWKGPIDLDDQQKI